MLAELERDIVDARLAAAQAELDRRKAELDELVAGARPEELEAARARVEAARLRLQLARRRLARVQSLYERGGARDEELDDAATSVEQASQLLREADAQYRLLQAGTRPERIAQSKASVRSQEAVLAQIRSEQAKHVIQAPFAGYVVQKFIETGAWLRQGDPVVELVELDEVYVEAAVPEQDVARLRDDFIARVSFDSIPERSFQSETIMVIPRAFPATRNFPVRVLLKNVIQQNGWPLIKVGYSARVTLATGPETEATLVPKDALLLNTNPPVIYVVPADSLDRTVPARAVPVTVIGYWRQWVAVEGDVRPGEWVVVRGNERLAPEKQVTVIELIPAERLLQPQRFSSEIGSGSR